MARADAGPRNRGWGLRWALACAGGVAGALSFPAPALADHLSGGTPDLMGAFGGISLVLVFLGLLGVVGLWPGRLKPRGNRWGIAALVAGLLVLVGGSWYSSRLGSPEENLGGAAWGRLVVQQFAGLFLVFSGFSAAVMAWAVRHGVLSFGEGAKYAILHNGDPAEPGIRLPPRQPAEGLVWIPVAGMILLALLIAGGLAYVALTLGAS